jgi:hypothetical protein
MNKLFGMLLLAAALLITPLAGSAQAEKTDFDTLTYGNFVAIVDDDG